MKFKYSTKRIKQINNAKIEKDLKYIILGIYIIESTYRNTLLRIVEYVVAIFNICLNYVFNKPIKNYTLGPFQIGISSILIFNGYKEFEIHQKYIKKLNFEQLKTIVHGIEFKNNFEICFWKVKDMYAQVLINTSEYYSIIGNVGELYNGSIKYGFLLQNIVEKLCLSEK